MGFFKTFNSAVERSIEYSVFASRWFQAVVYLGLIVGGLCYTYKFMGELLVLWNNVTVFTEVEVMLSILGLIDISMVLNLLTIVVIGGYTIFTSRLDFTDTEDRPLWLDNLDADRLKVKLSTSLASISGVHLLKSFIDVHANAKEDLNALQYEVAIHLVFIVSALVLGWIVKLLAHKHEESVA